jgi:hypothetical protein
MPERRDASTRGRNFGGIDLGDHDPRFSITFGQDTAPRVNDQ